MAAQPAAPAAPEALLENLEEALARYSGYTKILRLQAALEAARAAGDAGLERKVVEMGLACAHADDVPGAYLVFAHVNENRQLGLAVDLAWADRRRAELDQELARLEGDQGAARATAVKEQIRMCNNNIGDLHYRLGSFTSALKSYTRARDYCSDTSHNLDTCLRIVRASVGAQNFTNVPSWTNRGMNFISNGVGTEAATAQLHAASGLANMWQEQVDFVAAAESFLNVGLELGNTFNDVITCEDVALYGGLCALASFDRVQLRSRVLSHPTFRTMLESVPFVREMLNDFVGSRYDALSRQLAAVRARASVDIHLRKCFPDLARCIQRRCLKQYILPFSSASLDLMANVFNISRDAAERDVAKLIVDQEIKATIDRESGFIDVFSEDARQAAFRDTLLVGKRFAQDLEGSILRSNLRRQGLVYNPAGTLAQTAELGPEDSLGDEGAGGGGGAAAGERPGAPEDASADADTGVSDRESDAEMDDAGDRSAIATPT